MTDDYTRASELRKGLGLVETIALVVGGTIGTSIFVIPGSVAASAGSPFFAIMTWCIAALFALAAALCLAELSSAIPRTGGPYAFLRRAYRLELIPFSYAWMISFAYGPGAMAVVAIISATFAGPYVEAALHLTYEPVHEIALALLSSVCIINLLGVRIGGMAQSILTLGKVVLLGSLILLAFVFLRANFAALAPSVSNFSHGIPYSGMTAGLLLCIFAFNGAHFATLAAGEVRSPAKVIPLAIFIGTAVVTMLYLSFNIAIFSTLPFSAVVTSKRIAFDLMYAALGPPGATVSAVAVISSGVAVLNAQCLGYPRVLFSLADDGLFLRRVAGITPRTRVPSVAILTCTVCAALYVFSGTYTDILGYVSFVSQLFTTLMVLSVILLRIREPSLARPYRVWGYPWTPVVFVLSSSAYLVELFVTKTATVTVGILIVAAGFPFYLLFRTKKTDAESSPHGSHRNVTIDSSSQVRIDHVDLGDTHGNA